MHLALNSNGPMTISNRFLPLSFPIKREPCNGATTGDDSLHAAITISEPVVGFDLSYFAFTGNGSASDLVSIVDTSKNVEVDSERIWNDHPTIPLIRYLTCWERQ